MAEPPLDDAVLRQVCDVLGDTNAGLTTKQIVELLAAAKIRDPTPRSAGAGTYVVKNKRDRLYDALTLSQRETKSANAALNFVKIAMAPARYGQEPEVFESRQRDLNIALAWASLRLTDDGRLRRTSAATSLTDARRRAARLRHVLADRDAHPRLLAGCVDEIRDDNYFHAVLEGARSIAAEIQRRTDSTLDGVPLVKATCERTSADPVPLLALNRLETQTERSR